MDKSSTSELECIQCNKCQLSCPLNRVDPTYSPRGNTHQLLLDGDKTMIISISAGYFSSILRMGPVNSSGSSRKESCPFSE